MKLGKILAEGIINEGKEIIGVFGGSFKPPTSGHFSVLKKVIEENPHINKFIVYVGSGTRDNVSQADSVSIWNLYKEYLDSNIEIIPVTSPVRSVYDLSKNNPDKNIKWFLGSREDREQDIADFNKRTSHSDKYDNLEVINIIIPQSSIPMSGTNARKALKQSKEEFFNYLPQELSSEDKEEVYSILSNNITENKIKEATFFGRLGLKWDKFLDALKNEKKETQEAFDLLLKSSKGEIELSPEQKKQIGEQLKSTFKSIGFISLIALPGGTIFFLLLKFLKLNKFVTPNSFQIKEAKQVSKKYLDEVFESELIGENQIPKFTGDFKKYLSYINKLADYVCKDLQIEKPEIVLINGTKYTQENKSFGGYMPGEKKIITVIKGRNLRDSCVTLAHEIRHFWQDQQGLIKPGDGKDGDDIENDAQSYAGMILRKFGRENPEIFLLSN